MEKILELRHYDLVTPDGAITNLRRLDDKTAEATIFIEDISPAFVGFQIDPKLVFFNIKSTVAQVGLNGLGQEYELDPKNHCAQIKVLIKAIGELGVEMLKLLQPGAKIGKLFAADERRRVRNPDYLARMFGRFDRWKRPLLLLGGRHDGSDLILDKIDGRTVAYLALQNGRLVYEQSIHGFLHTLAKALITDIPMREVLKLHQMWKPRIHHNIQEDEILLVRTLPLHIRTVFGRVVNEQLSEGYHHTTASVLQPDTTASGDIYELFGKSKREIN